MSGDGNRNGDLEVQIRAHQKELDFLEAWLEIAEDHPGVFTSDHIRERRALQVRLLNEIAELKEKYLRQ